MDAIYYGNILLMKNNHNAISTRKYSTFFLSLLVAVTVIFPFANLFDLLYPAKIFGKSAWIVLPVMIIGLFYIYLLVKNSRLSTADIMFVIIVALCWLIFLVREVIYNEQRSFLDFRFVATTLLFIIVAIYVMKDTVAIRIMAYAVVIQGLLVAATRSINFYFFPSYMVSYEDNVSGEAFINTQGDVTRDLLLGSSSSANHIVCGMFIVLVLQKYNLLKLGLATFILIQFFMMLSTLNTLSRFPIFVAIVFFALSMFQKKLFSIKNIMYFALAGVLMFIFTSWLGIGELELSERFSDDAGGRFEKFVLMFTLVQNSVTDFLIGSSSALVLSTAINSYTISDNSYVLVATTFGVPFALVYFMFLFNIFLKIKLDKLSLLFIFYIAAELGVTNSILWEPWTFTAFFVFSITSYYGRLSSNEKKLNCRLPSKLYPIRPKPTN